MAGFCCFLFALGFNKELTSKTSRTSSREDTKLAKTIPTGHLWRASENTETKMLAIRFLHSEICRVFLACEAALSRLIKSLTFDRMSFQYNFMCLVKGWYTDLFECHMSVSIRQTTWTSGLGVHANDTTRRVGILSRQLYEYEQGTTRLGKLILRERERRHFRNLSMTNI